MSGYVNSVFGTLLRKLTIEHPVRQFKYTHGCVIIWANIIYITIIKMVPFPNTGETAMVFSLKFSESWLTYAQ